MNRLDTAIQNREIVSIGARAGHAVGSVGIALGYNAQYDTVKIGFVDENGEYTGEYTRVGAGHVEYTAPETEAAPTVNGINNFPAGDTDRGADMTYTTENYGKAVEFTDVQGHVVKGTIRWEDSHGVKMDIPGRVEGLYVSNAFLRRSF